MKRVTHRKKPSRFREFWPERQGPPFDVAIAFVVIAGTAAVLAHLLRR